MSSDCKVPDGCPPRNLVSVDAVRHLAQPLAVPGGAKVLHIGLPKTGTTAVQDALHTGRDVLFEHGVFNAAPNRHPQAAARFAVGRPLAHRTDNVEQAWQHVARRFRESTARVTVLSSEAFSLASRERARAVVEDLGGDVRVVVTLRAPAAQLRSGWQESFLGGGTKPFDDWAAEVLGDEKRLGRGGPRAILDAWAPVVGEDQILFMVSDPGDRNALFRRFEVLLGIAEGTLVVSPRDNTALPAAGSEFLRQLNLLDTSKRDRPRSVRAEILRRGSRRMRHMRGISPDPVRVPRWAAARANEIADTWIAQLDASSASVVGRLEDLLKEIEGLPERVARPEQIDVADAARFAHAFYDAAVRYHEKARRTPGTRLEEVSTRDLLALLGARAARRIPGRSSPRG